MSKKIRLHDIYLRARLYNVYKVSDRWKLSKCPICAYKRTVRTDRYETFHPYLATAEAASKEGMRPYQSRLPTIWFCCDCHRICILQSGAQQPCLSLQLKSAFFLRPVEKGVQRTRRRKSAKKESVVSVRSALTSTEEKLLFHAFLGSALGGQGRLAKEVDTRGSSLLVLFWCAFLIPHPQPPTRLVGTPGV